MIADTICLMKLAKNLKVKSNQKRIQKYGSC